MAIELNANYSFLLTQVKSMLEEIDVYPLQMLKPLNRGGSGACSKALLSPWQQHHLYTSACKAVQRYKRFPYRPKKYGKK